MSLRVVPKAEYEDEVNATKFAKSAGSVDLADTLREQKGPLSIASQVNGRHPLESRVQQWDATQQATRLEMYKRMFGGAEPMKRVMEMSIVDQTDFRPQVLEISNSSVHEDILMGKEMSVDWEDVYCDSEGAPMEFHSELQRKMGM